MVLRKPYAFLIKHFRLIHLLLCIPFVYLLLRTGSIVRFFQEYVVANYHTNETNIAGQYLNYFMYLAIILILVLVLAVFFLMRQKKKDTKLYLLILIYYILLFILFSVAYNILNVIEFEDVTAQAARTYRDISLIVYLPQFFFILYTFLRGIGFDIKKFNFEQDVKELEITDIDNEEFELILGKNNYKYKRTIRRFFREFGYYVSEYKLVFSILVIIILAILGTLIYLHFGVYNKTYRQTQKVSHNNLTVSVVNSILSNLDNGGKEIDGKYYLAIALKIKNATNQNKTLDYENFKIEVQNTLINSTLDRTSYFVDLGIPYRRDTQILPQSENIYVLTYEIPEKWISAEMNLKILESLTYDIGSVTPSYKTIRLKYEKKTETKEIKRLGVKKILELSETYLGLSQIQIQGYQKMKTYEYSYKSCYEDYCQDLKNKISASSKKVLIVIKRMFELDRFTNYYQASRKGANFTNDYLQIRYKLGNETKTIRVKDVTPKELKNEWVFEVNEEIQEGTDLELIVNVRGNLYVMAMED